MSNEQQRRKVSEYFDALDKPNNLLYFDFPLPLNMSYGIDENGCLCICFTVDFIVPLPKSTSILKFSQSQSRVDGEYTVYISLTDVSKKGVFFSFCQDLIDCVSGKADDGSAAHALVERIGMWKSMFSRNSKFLSASDIKGLFGELYFLHTALIPNLGSEKAVKAWSGPLGLSKDFAINLDWYEVKTTGGQSTFVTISSHEQLLSDNPGHLVIVRVEEMGEAFNNGIPTINALFEVIRNEISNNPAAVESFLERLEKKKYSPEDEYNKYRFKVVTMDSYLVDENFPKITKPTKFGTAFSHISYGLLINALSPYKEAKEPWTTKD